MLPKAFPALPATAVHAEMTVVIAAQVLLVPAVVNVLVALRVAVVATELQPLHQHPQHRPNLSNSN